MDKDSFQKIYFGLSLFFTAIVGWSFGLLFALPLSIISSTYHLILFISSVMILWLIFGMKFLRKIEKIYGVE